MSKVLDEKLQKMSKEEQNLWALRHTAEHVLHTAMQNLYPKLKKAMGPATPEGFYFDFDLEEKVSEEDFPKIEKEMQRIINLDLPMVQEFISPEEAKKRGAKSIVARDVIRIITPGTLTEDSLLDARAANNWDEAH